LFRKYEQQIVALKLCRSAAVCFLLKCYSEVLFDHMYWNVY